MEIFITQLKSEDKNPSNKLNQKHLNQKEKNWEKIPEDLINEKNKSFNLLKDSWRKITFYLISQILVYKKKENLYAFIQKDR